MMEVATMDPNTFIARVKNGAIASMNKYGVLASITIAQAILESGWGESGLTRSANNLFGIKCGSSWKGKRQTATTAEYDGSGHRYMTNADFRKYDTLDDSVEDHGDFLSGNKRYAKVIGEKDYKKAAQALKDAGYATDPNYPKLLISLINQYNLDKYDTPKKNMPTLKFGTTGDAVKTLQKILKVKVDGLFGKNTEDALKAYQKAHKLTVDGIAGEKTWNKMGY